MIIDTKMAARWWPKLEKNGPWPVVRSGRPVPPGRCWSWTASKDSSGYGNFWLGGKTVGAHRRAYELLVGPIPEVLTIDHLCFNPGCVNPEHMQPVPSQVNTLRGESFSAVNAVKTHCIHGHEFTPENTYIARNGSRHCRECQRQSDREYKARKREEEGSGGRSTPGSAGRAPSHCCR